MYNGFLEDLLKKYSVDDNFAKEVREEYRLKLEEVLSKAFSVRPNFRYGGSIAKNTANTNDCDIDLLCYLDSDAEEKVEEIYEKAEKILRTNGYMIIPKNSAICVKGLGTDIWEMTVDVVPGKYTSNDRNSDVYLWCNRTRSRMKSNPEVQINKVKNSNSKDVIRVLKLFRSFNNFHFKSFYLEIFCIDVVEKEYDKDDNLYDKLIKFCILAEKIGEVTIHDPANSKNDIMNILNGQEFIIKSYFKKLLEALLTNNQNCVESCIMQKEYNIDSSYEIGAKDHSNIQTKFSSFSSSGIKLYGYIIDSDSKHQFQSETTHKKGEELEFEISYPYTIKCRKINIIVCNSGYDALKNNCPRGKEEETKYSSKNLYTKTEHTSYYGNHYVQAVGYTEHGLRLFSNYLIVKIRDKLDVNEWKNNK